MIEADAQFYSVSSILVELQQLMFFNVVNNANEENKSNLNVNFIRIYMVQLNLWTNINHVMLNNIQNLCKNISTVRE